MAPSLLRCIRCVLHSLRIAWRGLHSLWLHSLHVTWRALRVSCCIRSIVSVSLEAFAMRHGIDESITQVRSVVAPLCVHCHAPSCALMLRGDSAWHATPVGAVEVHVRQTVERIAVAELRSLLQVPAQYNTLQPPQYNTLQPRTARRSTVERISVAKRGRKNSAANRQIACASSAHQRSHRRRCETSSPSKTARVGGPATWCSALQRGALRADQCRS